MSNEQPCVLFLCTGNAARSVMAAAMLTDLRPDVVTISAGTHVIEGQPMSWRTRAALEEGGVPIPRHRSRQLSRTDLPEVDVLVGLATEHVAYVRRTHPEAAGRTGTLRRLCHSLDAGAAPLRERVTALGLADVALESWEDVVDPAGGELADYIACARDIDVLLRCFAPLLGGAAALAPGGPGPTDAGQAGSAG